MRAPTMMGCIVVQQQLEIYFGMSHGLAKSMCNRVHPDPAASPSGAAPVASCQPSNKN